MMMMVLGACGSSPSEEPVPTTRPVLTTTRTPLTTTTTIELQQTKIYFIQPGDTLNAIALGFGVTAEALMEANGITDPTTLQPGQQLVIPAPEEPEPDADESAGTTVPSG